MAVARFVGNANDGIVASSGVVGWQAYSEALREPLWVHAKPSPPVDPAALTVGDSLANGTLYSGYRFDATVIDYNDQRANVFFDIIQSFVEINNITIPAGYAIASAAISIYGKQVGDAGAPVTSAFAPQGNPSIPDNTIWGGRAWRASSTPTLAPYYPNYLTGANKPNLAVLGAEFNWSGDEAGPGSSTWFDPAPGAASTLGSTRVNDPFYVGFAANQVSASGDQYLAGGNDNLITALTGAVDLTKKYVFWTPAAYTTAWLDGQAAQPATYFALNRFHHYYLGLNFIAGSNSSDVDKLLAPQIVLYLVPKNTLMNVLGASRRLNDFSTVWLDVSGTSVVLKRRDTAAGSVTTLGTITDGNLKNSYQGFDIAVDSLDNIYVIGPKSTNSTWFAKAFEKTATNTWTARTALTFDDSYDAVYQTQLLNAYNNFSSHWTKSTDTTTYPKGFLYVIASHRFGQTGDLMIKRNQIGVTLDCAKLLSATASGSMISRYDHVAGLNGNKFWPRNPTGTGLDSCNLSDLKSVGISYEAETKNTKLIPERCCVGSITSNADGTGATTIMPYSSSYLISGPKHDGAAKLRIMPMYPSTDKYAFIQSGKLSIRLNSTPGTVVTDLQLTSAGIANFPTFDTLIGSAAWDAYYDRAHNTIWIYYVDSANPRRLMCVGFDCATNALITPAAPREVSTNIGLSGSTISAIRIPRGRVDERWIHIDIASANADGTFAALTYEDTAANVAPNKPVIQDVVPFLATAQGNVVWTFSDLNPNDRQAQYEIQVRTPNASPPYTYQPGVRSSTLISGALPLNGATVTEKIDANTLNNNTVYQARVRTYDITGAISDWSDWKSFSTSTAGGSVTILTPADDNLPLSSSSVLVEWVFNPPVGVLQAKYTIKVYRTDTNALLQTIGPVTSTATSAIVSSLVSDVEQRIEVVVTGNQGSPLTSAAGVRLVTPVFGRPRQPIVSLSPQDVFMRINITNPPPGTDQAQALRNDIYRRKAATATESAGSWVRIAMMSAINTSYDDYSVASGTKYDYYVQAVS